MDEWLLPACDYIGSWLEFQMRLSRLPGCIVVIVHRDQIALERAYGSADLAASEALTPRHRFRVASHSKAFTAAGVMKLREAGKLRVKTEEQQREAELQQDAHNDEPPRDTTALFAERPSER